MPQMTTSPLSVELGMPLLGRCNLSENALLKLIGNDRWRQIQDLGGTPTSLIRDDAGARLYATFFFIELKLSPERPLSAYGENQTLNFATDLAHHGKVYLDGTHRLDGSEDFFIRSSNVFIYQERGPSKLSLAIPENMDFSRIHSREGQPDSLGLCREARSRGTFLEADSEDFRLFEGWKTCTYAFDPDRDMNG